MTIRPSVTGVITNGTIHQPVLSIDESMKQIHQHLDLIDKASEDLVGLFTGKKVGDSDPERGWISNVDMGTHIVGELNNLCLSQALSQKRCGNSEVSATGWSIGFYVQCIDVEMKKPRHLIRDQEIAKWLRKIVAVYQESSDNGRYAAVNSHIEYSLPIDERPKAQDYMRHFHDNCRAIATIAQQQLEQRGLGFVAPG